MLYGITTATRRVSALKQRIRVVAGGTSASKTISILLNLISLAQADTAPTLTSIVSESFPHLKRGAMRDFLNILETHQYFDPKRWNKSDYTYTFETGSKIEFFSADQPSKVRGPRRDRLFLNECNNVPYETFDQLEVRTNEFVFLDFNPTNEFWFYTDLQGQRNDIDFITLTYKDNEALAPAIVASIEQRRGNTRWWRVYGEGQLGEAIGRIYNDWQLIEEIPHEARFQRFGLNFGYSNHPLGLVAIYFHNGGFILDEVLYGLGFKNREIADTIKSQTQQGVIMADSAEPKSIAEIHEHGLNILGVEKGKDSVLHGIQYVQDQRISVTKTSLNIIREYRNYMWAIDKQTGKPTNEPEEPFHYIMDAVRYGIVGLKPVDPIRELKEEILRDRQRQEQAKESEKDFGL